MYNPSIFSYKLPWRMRPGSQISSMLDFKPQSLIMELTTEMTTEISDPMEVSNPMDAGERDNHPLTWPLHHGIWQLLFNHAHPIQYLLIILAYLTYITNVPRFSLLMPFVILFFSFSTFILCYPCLEYPQRPSLSIKSSHGCLTSKYKLNLFYLN